MQAKWRYAAAVVAAVSVMAISGAAQAHWPIERVSVEIIDRTDGRVLPIYSHEGRRYVIGRPGNEYGIRVRNGGNERALAVMSVDGVNVISGDTASRRNPDTCSARIRASRSAAGGLACRARRRSFYDAAEFLCRAHRASDNVGVIGVAVFRERPRVVQQFGGKLERQDAARDEVDRAASAPAAPSARAQADSGAMAEKKSQIGTGYGRSETSYAQYTDFQRASDTPSETIAIYYDSYENLLAQGVPVAPAPIARSRPEPFPDGVRFAPPPPR